MQLKYKTLFSFFVFYGYIRLSSNFLTKMFLTLSLLLLQSPDCLELLDDGGEGVGDDSDHDEEGEEEDEDRGHDQLDVRARHASILLETILADPRQYRGCILKQTPIIIHQEQTRPRT